MVGVWWVCCVCVGVGVCVCMVSSHCRVTAFTSGSMRMQLTELIAAQHKLKSERDVAIQQGKMAEERAGKMEKQLKELKILHSE